LKRASLRCKWSTILKAGWSWGCVSAADSCGRMIWIVDAHRDDGKRFVAAHRRIAQSTEPNDVNGAARPFEYCSKQSKAIVRPNYASRGPCIQARAVTKRRRREPPTLLNSARRHCIAPRRRRRVKWRDRRRWVKWSDRRASRTSRRIACGASYKSVGNARSIDVTTTDISLLADSV
jgi:hypothetical protein